MRSCHCLLFLLSLCLRAAEPVPAIPAGKDMEPSLSEAEALIVAQAAELAKTNAAAAATQLRANETAETSAAIEFAEAVYWADATQTDEAQNALRRALAKYPRFHRARMNLAKLLMEQEDYAAASLQLRALLSADAPDRAEAWRLLAYALREQQLLPAAETAYREAMAFYPEDRALRLGLLSCLIEQERYAEAVPWARQELAVEPDRREFWGLLANAELAADQRDRALRLLECAHRLGAADPAMLAVLGDLYLDQELPEPALACYREAALLDHAPVSRLLAGFEALVLSRNLTEASRLDEVLSQRQDQYTPGQRLRYRTLRAALAAATGRTEDAIGTYRQVLDEDPIQGEALLALGDLLLARNPDEARELFLRAARLDRYQTQAWTALARLAVEQGDMAAAANWVQQALARKADPALERYLAQIRAATP